jgi:hypothetical protein
MSNSELIEFYERDIQKLIQEIKAFKNEENLWRTVGTINNSSGNLALHLIGGMNFLISTTLGNSGYVRNREQEFTTKGVDREIIISQLLELIATIKKAITPLNEEELAKPFPIYFDKENATKDYVLTQLLLHLNYHLGQINYLRRSLE